MLLLHTSIIGGPTLFIVLRLLCLTFFIISFSSALCCSFLLFLLQGQHYNANGHYFNLMFSVLIQSSLIKLTLALLLETAIAVPNTAAPATDPIIVPTTPAVILMPHTIRGNISDVSFFTMWLL